MQSALSMVTLSGSFKFEPWMVMLSPDTPDIGVTDVIVGNPDDVTVNDAAKTELTPPLVTTRSTRVRERE